MGFYTIRHKFEKKIKLVEATGLHDLATTSNGDYLGVESDLPLFTPVSAPALMLEKDGFAKETALPQSRRPSIGSSNHQDRRSGLSAGEKAGIAIGVVVSVALLLASVMLVLRKKRRAKQQRHTGQRAGSPHSMESRRPYIDAKGELTAIHIVELPEKEQIARSRKSILDGSRESSEKASEAKSFRQMNLCLRHWSQSHRSVRSRRLGRFLRRCRFLLLETPQELAADEPKSRKR